jgi:molybdopterin/thiamine biosynthesis adenylyltransferase
MITAEIDFWRSAGILSPEKALNTRVVVVGVGGIGSPTVMALAKMGIGNIQIWDHDIVNTHNIPNQMYFPEHLGGNKAEIMAEFATKLGAEVDARVEEFTDQDLSGIVIVSVDSMKARRKIWRKAKYNSDVSLFIDARMGGEMGMIFAINSCHFPEVKYYESTLYSDEEASELPCTARAIIYNTFGIAAMISSIVSKKIMEKDYPKEILFDYVNYIVSTKQSV